MENINLKALTNVERVLIEEDYVKSTIHLLLILKTT